MLPPLPVDLAADPGPVGQGAEAPLLEDPEARQHLQGKVAPPSVAAVSAVPVEAVAPGLNLRVGGAGGRGGRAPAGRPQGVPALFGLQRVMRQRANQVHLSLYDTYTNSAFDAQPYSLTQINPPKIPTWGETTGGNLGGPLRIPHIYDGSDRTFFFVNFESAWTRSAVDQFSTVPTAFERENPGDFCDVPGVQIYVPTDPRPRRLERARWRTTAAARFPAGC